LNLIDVSCVEYIEESMPMTKNIAEFGVDMTPGHG
jgi:hypothetical protein